MIPSHYKVSSQKETCVCLHVDPFTPGPYKPTLTCCIFSLLAYHYVNKVVCFFLSVNK